MTTNKVADYKANQEDKDNVAESKVLGCEANVTQG